MKNLLLIFKFLFFQSSFMQAQQAGSLDFSFDDDGKLEPTTILVNDLFKSKTIVSHSGGILAASSGNSNTSTILILASFNQDGSANNSFGVSGVFTYDISGLQNIYDMVILSDNSIIILANSTNPVFGNFIIKITSNGILETSFGINGMIKFPDFHGRAMVLQPDEKIVLGGQTYINFANNIELKRLNPNGTYDLSFGNDGLNNDGKTITDFGVDNEYLSTLNIDIDGKLIVSAYAFGQQDYNHYFSKYNADGSLDTTFDMDGKLILTPELLGFDGTSGSVLLQSDSKILVFANGFRIYRLTKNGIFDTSFGINGIITHSSIGSVTHAQIQQDGKIVAATYINHQVGIARLNTDGTLDNSFDSDGVQNISFLPITGNKNPSTLAIQADGKIVFGCKIGYRFVFVRLHGITNFNSNQGKIPTQFTTFNDEANAIALRAGGKPIVVGNVTNAQSSTSGTDFGIVAYNADGGLDLGFGSNGFASISFDANDRANAVAVQTNGKILVAGKAANSSHYNLVVVRYNANGTLDNTFGIAGTAILEIDFFDSEATSIAYQTDGKILVTGLSHDQFNDGFFAILARFNANGTIDNTFGTNGMMDLPAGNDYYGKIIKIQQDSKILITCISSSETGNFKLLRLESNGNIDNTFDTDGMVETAVGTISSFANSMALQSDNKIVVSGSAKVNGIDVFAMVRYNQNGSLDTSFDTDGIVLTNFYPLKATSTAMAIQPDGKIFLTGKTTSTLNSDVVLARYLGNGSLDNSFDSDGIIIQEVGYGNVGANAIISTANGVAYLAGYYHNGHDNDFLIMKLLPCYQESLTLLSPTENYPNSTLPNSQIAKNIYASNRLFSGSDISYQSENSITLNPGFKVENGAVFKTEIVGCSY